MAWIDIRCYGFWGEHHRYGATHPWPDSLDKRELIKTFIDWHFEAFNKTPLVVQTAGDKGEPYPKGTAIDYAIEKGSWMRRDGFGRFLKPEHKSLLQKHWKHSLVVAENGDSIRALLDGKIEDHQNPENSPVTVDDMYDQMFECHANYTPLGWGIDGYKALRDERPDLLKEMSLKTGYRFVIEKASWPKAVHTNDEFTIKTTWKNTAVGRLPYTHTPVAYLRNANGDIIASDKCESVDMTKWYKGNTYETKFSFSAPKKGDYAILIGVENEQGKPAIKLGIQGEQDNNKYFLGIIPVR